MTQDEAKRMAARRALEFVEDGMLLGLGSGTTSAIFIQELGERVKQGLRVQLEQSPFLNVLYDQQVNDELRLMGRSSERPLTSDVARDLCQRLGSKAVSCGSSRRTPTLLMPIYKSLRSEII